MPTKIRVSLLSAIVLLIVCLGCSSNKANEKQQAANQQEASPTATPEPSAAPAPSPATAPPEQPSPSAKKKSNSGPLPSTTRDYSTPSAETPTPTPTPTPAPTPITVPSGTAISIRTTSALSTKELQANQAFEASMAKPVIVHGETVIPVGAPVKGVILKSQAAGRVKGEGGVMLQLTSLTLHGKSYKLVANAVSQEAKGRGKRSAAMIGGGGGAGALIGGLAGGGKGAAIGAIAGAAAGTAGATMTGKRDVVIPAETVLDFKLTAPLTLPPPQGGESPEHPPMSMPPEHPDTGSQPPAQQPPPSSQPPSSSRLE